MRGEQQPSRCDYNFTITMQPMASHPPILRILLEQNGMDKMRQIAPSKWRCWENYLKKIGSSGIGREANRQIV
jgi:hypothetical protein